MKPILIRCAILLALSLVTISGERALARQAESTETSEELTEDNLSAEAREFRDLQKKLRANENRIAYLLRNLPIGFPDRRAKYRAEMDRLVGVNDRLRLEVFSKAKAAFKSSEQPSVESTQIIQKKLNAMLKPRNVNDAFDPEGSLELIAMMKEKFPETPQLLEFEFLANYAIERFENAEKALVRLEDLTGADLSDPRQELRATMDKYQQELMIRRLENNTDDLPRVLLVTTEGDILVELFENHAPNTVANFIHLVRDQKFYDGKLFHLVKPGEYAMTGSPNGDGMGDAGYRIPCECHEGKIRSHFRGTLSMMAPSKDRGGSQFFITQQPNPHTFDGKYTAFGRVVEGLDVLMKLKNVDLTGRLASTADVSKIVRAEVVRSRSHTYMPKKLASAVKLPEFDSAPRRQNADVNSDDAMDDTPSSFDLLLQDDEGGK